jgi:hypothetical protein
MAETLVVFAVVGLLVVLGLMAALLPPETLVLVGVTCIATGFVLGVPAGTYYHVKLYRCLAARGGVPSDFFWHPTRYHDQLPRTESRKFMPWFVAGAVGFMLILLGCSIVMLGVMRA